MWRAPQSRARLSLRQPEPKFRGESGQQQDLAVPNPSLALQDICPNAGNPIRLTPSTIQLLEQGELGRVRAEFLDDDGARWSLGPLSGRDKIIDLEESRPDPQEGVISTLLIKPLDEMRRALVRIQEQRNLQGRLLVKAKPLDQKATFEQTSRWLSLVGVEPSLEWAPGPRSCSSMGFHSWRSARVRQSKGLPGSWIPIRARSGAFSISPRSSFKVLGVSPGSERDHPEPGRHRGHSASHGGSKLCCSEQSRGTLPAPLSPLNRRQGAKSAGAKHGVHESHWRAVDPHYEGQEAKLGVSRSVLPKLDQVGIAVCSHLNQYHSAGPTEPRAAVTSPT